MLVDTNVLVDVLQNDTDWVDGSISQLRAQSQIHRLIINPIVYAELSLTFSRLEALDRVLAKMVLPVVEVLTPALFLAGKAFVEYRRGGGQKSNVLADFFIGAHAAVARIPVLTRDVQRYQNYFPSVRLVTPELK